MKTAIIILLTILLTSCQKEVKKPIVEMVASGWEIQRGGTITRHSLLEVNFDTAKYFSIDSMNGKFHLKIHSKKSIDTTITREQFFDFMNYCNEYYDSIKAIKDRYNKHYEFEAEPQTKIIKL